MAQTKRKRRTKHRGTAAGTIQTRGRTGRPPSADDKKKQTRMEAREKRLNTPPTWKSSIIRAGLAAVLMFIFLALVGPKSHRIESALFFAVFACAIYIPGGYYIEMFMYRRRLQKKQQGGASQMIDARMFTVGPVQENCFIVRRKDATNALIVDPGDEAPKLLGALESLGIETVEAILDHPHPLRPHRRGGAGGRGDQRAGVLPRARKTRSLRTSWTTSRGRASARSRAMTPTTPSAAARRSSSRASRSTWSSPRVTAPGTSRMRSPTRARCSRATSCSRARSGGSTFRAATGRRCWRSIEKLTSSYSPETTVYPGHMGITTLGRERATNPFLRELAER